jgi:hypothetical protein
MGDPRGRPHRSRLRGCPVTLVVAGHRANPVAEPENPAVTQCDACLAQPWGLAGARSSSTTTAAVLLPHHGCDRRRDLPPGTEMVMPGDNTDRSIELIQPIAVEDGSPVRDPRWWPHRRHRPGHQDQKGSSSTLFLSRGAVPPVVAGLSRVRCWRFDLQFSFLLCHVCIP